MSAPDPATMFAIANMILSIVNPGGKDEERGSTYTQGQQDLINQGTNGLMGGSPDITQNQNYQGGSEWLNSLFNDPEFFKNFEAPLMRQFNEDIIPGLANRFGGQGSHGSLSSTGFRNQLGREASTLSEKIASLRGGLQQQGVNQSLQYAQQPTSNYLQQLQALLSPQPNNTYQGATNPWSNIAGPAVQNAFQNPNGMFGGGNNQQQNQGNGGNQFPLTNEYDVLARNGLFN